MTITWTQHGTVAVATLAGRLDAFGAGHDAESLHHPAPGQRLVLDCADLSYISSAGVRILLACQKAAAATGGKLALAAVQPFCSSVLEMSGLAGLIPTFATVDDAVRELADQNHPAPHAETCSTPAGTFVFHPLGSGTGTIDILGDIANVLDCAITEDLVAGKPFFETEYSLGLGALGAAPADYLPLMGESIMVAGTMVWLPTDGHDTPDYMIPRRASTSVVLHTGFNASLRGGFNEFVRFTAPPGQPVSVRDLYRALFDLAKTRRQDFHGVIGLAMRAEIDAAYGAGITKSPLLAHRPANGLPITDPANFNDWFESDQTPRHQGTTALICGAGEDLTANSSGIDHDRLRRMFYINPANRGATTEVLHNHAVFFTQAPPPAGTYDIDTELRRVVDEGTFADMRHLLDQTTLTSALIAVSYIQEVREDCQE